MLKRFALVPLETLRTQMHFGGKLLNDYKSDFHLLQCMQVWLHLTFLIVRVPNLRKSSPISISRGEGKALNTDSPRADNYMNKAAVPSSPWSSHTHMRFAALVREFASGYPQPCNILTLILGSMNYPAWGVLNMLENK